MRQPTIRDRLDQLEQEARSVRVEPDEEWQARYGHLRDDELESRLEQDMGARFYAIARMHQGKHGREMIDAILADPQAMREANKFARRLATGR